MFNFIKKAIIANRAEETILYEYVLDELEDGYKVRGLWAKALAMSEGDENKATSLYMQYRVQNIKDFFVSLKIAYEELSKAQIKNKLINLVKNNEVKNNVPKTRDIEIIKDEYERINCPHCNTYTYLKDENCFKCDKNIRKLDHNTIDKYRNYNGKSFVIKNKIDNDILLKSGNNLKIVRKALDLNKNENCGLNDYLIDGNNFEYLVLRNGNHHLVISNYGIKTQFNL